MKRLLVVLICIVLLCSVAAQADMFTPSEFFGFYRLEPVEEKASKSGVKWCALRDVKGETIINYSDGEKLYHVNDNPDMNDDDLPAPNIYMAFMEFCASFDFDAYLFRADGVRLVYVAEGVDIDRVFNLKPVDYRDERYNDRDAFVSALEGVIYKPGSYTTAETLISDMEAENDIRERLVDAIDELRSYSFEDMLRGSVLDRVEVNPNSGTPEGGDFIGLVYIVLAFEITAVVALAGFVKPVVNEGDRNIQEKIQVGHGDAELPVFDVEYPVAKGMCLFV